MRFQRDDEIFDTDFRSNLSLLNEVSKTEKHTKMNTKKELVQRWCKRIFIKNIKKYLYKKDNKRTIDATTIFDECLLMTHAIIVLKSMKLNLIFMQLCYLSCSITNLCWTRLDGVNH